jgi:hypothetical protein
MVHAVFPPVPGPDGELTRGFYTARTVDAADADAAELEAIALVAADRRTAEYAAEWRTELPEFLVAATVLLGVNDEIDYAPQGFILYDESGRAVGGSGPTGTDKSAGGRTRG